MPLSLLDLNFGTFPGWLLVAVLAVGFVGLIFGGDALTEGAASISVNLSINPVVVGLTVVSIATSMPEMFTSLLAARESPDMALGNILGSNIANIGLILGITAVIAPLRIQLRLIQREVPILLVVTALYMVMAGNGYSRAEGIFLLIVTVLYLGFVVRWALTESRDSLAEFGETAKEEAGLSTPKAAAMILVGGGALAIGAELLVGGCVEIAARAGLSEALIGLTIIAVGTSLPELAASIAAVRANHGDICAGNIVGSNLFNIILIGGCTAAFVPFQVDPRMLLVEFPAVLILSALLLVIFKTGHIVSRREGVFLLFLYLVILSCSGLSQQGFIF